MWGTKMEISQIQAVIEALLFAAGDPLPLDKICEILELDKKTAANIIKMMSVDFENSRGIIIREINSGYQLSTKPEYIDYVKQLFQPRQKQGLSQAAYEVLSIIAYKQPVTRAQIEQIRGVSSDSAINRLAERNLITEAGRLDAPGKPILYGTTDEFLRCFGFRNINDLPLLSLNPADENETDADNNVSL